MFWRTCGQGDKGGGRISLKDQNAYDGVMSALNSDELTSAKFGRVLSRTLNVSHRKIKRSRAIRKSMEDMDKKRWIGRSSVVPKNAIGEGEFGNFGLSIVFICSLVCTKIYAMCCSFHYTEH